MGLGGLLLCAAANDVEVGQLPGPALEELRLAALGLEQRHLPVGRWARERDSGRSATAPDREVTLLESERRKTEFLQGWTGSSQPPRLGPREEQPTEAHGVAVAKALAQPTVAAEWRLPLVEEGGAVVLWVGPSADADAVSRVAERVGGELEVSPPGFLVLRKTGPTPPGFPRRTGVAKPRPLA